MIVRQRSSTDIDVAVTGVNPELDEAFPRGWTPTTVRKDGSFEILNEKCIIRGQFSRSAMSRFWYISVKTKGILPYHTELCRILSADWYVDVPSMAGLEV